MDKNLEPGIQVDQLLLEKAEFAHRSDFLEVPPVTAVEAGEIDVMVESAVRPDGQAGLLRLRVSTKGECLYVVSLTMLGLFSQPSDRSNMSMKDFLYGPALALVFPFMREAFANLTMRGRFGPLWLAPFNAAEMGRKMRESAETTTAAGDKAELSE